ncbi:MAG TPA: SRPBCC family protein [Rhizomicrobium sp.]|nr:SRPBCC family protein [Rhizomicrobium sp.]
MSNSKFLYVTYIRTTAEKLWDALTNKDLMKSYWFNMHQESDWRAGSSWEMKDSKGEVWDSGTILESQRPHKLVISWQHRHHAQARAEGFSRMTYLIETAGPLVKLTVSHESDVENSDLIAKVSSGWPMVLSSLKSLLETGEALPDPRKAA